MSARMRRPRWKQEADRIRSVLGTHDELVAAARRLLLTHGCTLAINFEGEMNRCADCDDMRAALAKVSK